MNIAVQLVLGTVVSVDAFLEQYGLDGGIAKDDACGEQAVDDGEEDLDCATLAFSSGTMMACTDVRILFHWGTSNAPIVGSSPVCSVHVPTGLKDILRCRESGLASLLHGSCSSIDVTRCESDMMATASCCRAQCDIFFLPPATRPSRSFQSFQCTRKSKRCGLGMTSSCRVFSVQGARGEIEPTRLIF